MLGIYYLKVEWFENIWWEQKDVNEIEDNKNLKIIIYVSYFLSIVLFCYSMYCVAYIPIYYEIVFCDMHTLNFM